MLLNMFHGKIHRATVTEACLEYMGSITIDSELLELSGIMPGERIGEAVRIGAKMSGGEFPIEVFPIRVQRIISSLHDCQGYPVDYVAACWKRVPTNPPPSRTSRSAPTWRPG